MAKTRIHVVDVSICNYSNIEASGNADFTPQGGASMGSGWGGSMLPSGSRPWIATMSSDRSRGGQSDSPPRDLQREREQFLQNFTKGGRLSEEFVAELERVRTRLEELEAENAKLRAQVETDLAVRELLDKIQHLESEKSELLSRTHKAEAVSTEFSERFEEVESEFANLANLFVASNQLHASLSPRGVMRRIKEVLAQLVGAERYCVYLADRDQEQLVPVASEGLRADELVNQPLAEGPLGKVFSSGEAGVDETDPSRGVIERPAAVVPLSVDEQVVGLIAIFSTLAQKTKFDTIDFELFKLLGQHAASALVSASLYSQAERKMPGLEALLDLSV